MVNGRRKRLQVKRMKKQDGSWIEGEDALAEKATQFYHHQFTQEDISSDFSLLQHVPNMVTQEKNHILTSMPTLEDVKTAIFDLSGDSSGGPDGIIGAFYQVCWDIVGADVYNVVKVFFEGQTLPKFITHTNLNKLENVLPSLVSANQSGFVKGRCIIENVLLTQEVVSDIRLRGKPANVVLKLDMAKAYDRVSWDFFGKSFEENGICRKVLSRALNSLFEDNGFRSYEMPKWSANLNHLAYADDAIIFSSTDDTSLQLIMGILQEYEQMSGQLINKGKSSFYMHSKVANVIVQ
ncbi:uncharacterized protein LOC132628563 [Lycium barbarum]|uniref:uncharacterized protein LOC132628563 n=1 Tax=Lycium barbarum TaxID=112863 RepID=UPI00293EE6EE|nr:uncharacterized protein LOC132628563 [Lycium barbarum]